MNEGLNIASTTKKKGVAGLKIIFSGKVRDLVYTVTGTSLRERLTNELIDKQLEDVKIILGINEADWAKVNSAFRKKLQDYNGIADLEKGRWNPDKIAESFSKTFRKKLKRELGEEKLQAVKVFLQTKTLNPNSIIQSEILSKILRSQHFWQTLGTVKPKIFDLMVKHRAGIDE